MRLISLMYHDVVEENQKSESGFSAGSNSPYDLNRMEFFDHLEMIRHGRKDNPILVDSENFFNPAQSPWALTFDDGGISAYTVIAEELKKIGMLSHFFITTGKIGHPFFVNEYQIKKLREMGHIIGSHSHSHPERMSKCSWNELLDEWGTSVRILSDILSEKVTTASVPGGFYSKKVALAASQVGIKRLFTSEPFQKVFKVGDCLVLGRFTINKGVSADECAEIASGRWFPCGKQMIWWNAKKLAKKLGGKAYLRIRLILLKKSF